ncbi:Retrovirus-related Pol polyprotein from transposon opus [Ceratobasidium sp. AG-Ba]|nr:Retrovirus-related Pol polyprotein from transposon opus [Ceratobasidium sp. AG-Ba]
MPEIACGDFLLWERIPPCDVKPSSIIEIRIHERYAFVRRRCIGSIEYDVSDVDAQPKAFHLKGLSVHVTFATPEPARDIAAQALSHAQVSQQKERFMAKLGAVRGVIKAVLDFGGAVAELDPRAKAVFAVVNKVWEKLEAQEKCDASVESLLDGLAGILPCAEAVQDAAKLKELRKTVEEMWKLIEDASHFIDDYRSKEEVVRTLAQYRGSNAQEQVNEILARLQDLKEKFDRGIRIQALQTGERALQTGEQALHMVDEHVQRVLLEKLKPVGRARYDSSRACIPGTRERVIQDLLDWIKSFERPCTTAESKRCSTLPRNTKLRYRDPKTGRFTAPPREDPSDPGSDISLVESEITVESEDESTPSSSYERVYSSEAPSIEAFSVEAFSDDDPVVELSDQPTHLSTPPPTGARARANSDSEHTVTAGSPTALLPPGHWIGQSTPRTPVGGGSSLWPLAQHTRELPPHTFTTPVKPTARDLFAAQTQPAFSSSVVWPSAIALQPPQPPATPLTQPPATQPPQPPATPAAQPPPTQPQPHVMAGADKDEMHRVRKLLLSFRAFDGDEEDEREESWREEFEQIVDPYNVNEQQKAQLWRLRIPPALFAGRWVKQQIADDATALDTWTKVVDAVKKQWQPIDQAELQRKAMKDWYDHKFKEADAMTKVKGPGGAEEFFYVNWAREHRKLAQAHSVGGKADKLHHTWEVVLPEPIKGALRKGVTDYADVSTLCSDIMKLESGQVEIWSNLSKSKKPEIPEPPKQDLAEEIAALSQQIAAMNVANTRQQVRFNEPYARGASAAPKFASTGRTSYPRSTTNPPTNAPAQTPSGQSGPLRPPFTPRASASNLGRGRTFEDTPSGRAQYATALANKPNPVTPQSVYPLSPGTLRQTASICYRCGMGEHSDSSCRAIPLPAEELDWRKLVKIELINQQFFGRSPRTPATRIDTYQVLMEHEMLDEAREFVDETEEEEEMSGKGEGRCNSDGLEEYEQEIDVEVKKRGEIELSEKDSLQILPNQEGEHANPHTIPYQRWIELHSTSGSILARGTVDAGSQANVLDASLWAANEHQLGALEPSTTMLRVADGKASRCVGRWRGIVKLEQEEWEVMFEVFDSRGAFEVLLGKPWLTLAKAVQSFDDDTLWLPGDTGALENKYPLTLTEESELIEEGNGIIQTTREDNANVKEESSSELVETKQEPRDTEPIIDEHPAAENAEPTEQELEGIGVDEDSDGGWRRVPRRSQRIAKLNQRSGQGGKDNRTQSIFCVDAAQVEELERMIGMENDSKEDVKVRGNAMEDDISRALDRAERMVERKKQAERIAGNMIQENLNDKIVDTYQTEVDHSAHLPNTQSQRKSDPFAPSRVGTILDKVTIGTDLTESELKQVKDLVAEFADIFANNLAEVLPVKTHAHRLDIPEGTKFRKRVAQKPLSQAQKDWLYPTLEQMESANIIKRVPNTYPLAVSPTNVVPKPGGTSEPSLEYLQYLANKACEEAGIPAPYPTIQAAPPPPAPKEAKFRLVHNFAEVNDVTKIPPFPMGDLAAKQRTVAGHRFISTADFASGFNALPMEETSIKYTGFYVEGKGHYVYLRMPFGLTGAPTSFCEMLADCLHDLLGDGTEIWMDDIGMGFDDFDAGLKKTRKLFERCREKGLSLAPAKVSLFMTEAIFAGAKVSVRGIKPDPRKVQAILEWPEPETVLELLGFLGLTGAFRPKIRDYALIARPLSDLTRNVRVERRENGKSRKGEYKRALQNAKIELSEEGKRAFAELKIILTTDPILRAPVYDGQPFILTTDGSKYGFGGMLCQRWPERDTRTGRMKDVLYPIGFASKRTSRTEENYAPFVLEIAALKFSFDSFEQILMGQEVEVETDCKALADLLGNKKLSSTHERWRESIIAHRITAVRHRAGVENTVCDALSRKWQYREEDEGEGRQESVDPSWEAHKGLAEEMFWLVEDEGSKKVLERFEKDTYFGEIVQYLVLGVVYGDDITPSNVERAQKRAAHRAVGFEVADGKLWRIAGKGSHRAPRVECIPKEEGPALALATHESTGHFSRDLTILALQERYFWPNLRSDVVTAVTSCPRCRNFGPKLMQALLAPITRARPFDLICGDYLSLPVGSGGYKTVLLLVDVYSRFTFGFMTRNAGTGTFTVQCLEKLCDHIMAPSSFMSDNGSHFDCREVEEWGEKCGTSILHTPPYTPSANGLVEDANRILLGRLRALCSGDVGEVRGDPDRPPTPPPRSWPNFFREAIRQMNDRILPSLGYSPRELLTGILTADRKYQIGNVIRQQYQSESSPQSPVDVNMALAYALRNDAAERALSYAKERKRRFDTHARVMTAEAGDLVQKYDARWDNTYSNDRKLVPRWTGPFRIRERKNASYILEDLQGELVSLGTHAKHLRRFTPRPGSALAAHISSGGSTPVPEAGLGKSAVATSLCQALDDQRLLCASFFCKRDDPKRRSAQRALSSIIYGIASRHATYANFLRKALEEDPVLPSSPLQMQFNKLVLDLLSSSSSRAQDTHQVIVLDALDECGPEADRQQLLGFFVKMSELVPWLRVVITSRPDADIKEFFDGLVNTSIFSVRDLHSYDASNDIRAFTRFRLSESTKGKLLPEDSADELAKAAEGLFIWAHTACEFVLEDVDPSDALDTILRRGQSGSSHPLDELYTMTIQASVTKHRKSDRAKAAVRKYLGTIIVCSARTPLSIPTLSSLLEEDQGGNTLQSTVDLLGSVLYIDHSLGDAIRVYHPSFADYMLSKDRSGDFCVDLDDLNAKLASCCLRTMMAELRFNMCDLETSFLRNIEVPDLEARVAQVVSERLKYSCLYWANHIKDIESSKHRASLQSNLTEFARGPYLIFWVEALSLIGKLWVAISSVQELIDHYVARQTYLPQQLWDTTRLVQVFYQPISESTPHLYISALALMPIGVPTREVQRKYFPNVVNFISGARDDWPDRDLCMIHGYSVAISNDVRRVGPSLKTRTVRAWDANSAAPMGKLFEGHLYSVRSVAYSPDGRRIVSGSSNRTLRIWDALTGAPIGELLRGHSGGICSVAYSPDGRRIVSGSSDRTVRVWDADTGAPIGEPLEGHSSSVESVAYSPNGRRIVSGSRDKGVRVWDADTGAPIGGPFMGHFAGVSSVVYSPDGRRIVSGSYDDTVRIWDAVTGAPIGEPLKGHSDSATVGDRTQRR